MIASGKAGFDLGGGLASNGYGQHSPGKYPLYAEFLTGSRPGGTGYPFLACGIRRSLFRQQERG
jgi:hypothetical protein